SFVILASSLAALASAAAVDTTLETVTNIPTVIVDGLRKPLDSTTTGQLDERSEKCTEDELRV
ncbi:hypothetical protein C0992_006675, partial [Termitomyces sp. T32_za158]